VTARKAWLAICQNLLDARGQVSPFVALTFVEGPLEISKILLPIPYTASDGGVSSVVTFR
jgi:hypothetical protein